MTSGAPTTNHKVALIFPELSYNIAGIGFKAQNTLGRFAKEKQYCDLLEKLFQEKALKGCQELVQEHAKRELQKLLGSEAMPEEIKERAEELIKEASQKSHTTLSEALGDYSKNYQKIKDRKLLGFGIGIQTGWPKFNSLVGLRHQDVLVVGARPSIGKTAFGINLAMEVAASGQKVLFVSAEMGAQALLDRFLALATKTNISNFRYANTRLDNVIGQLGSIGGNLNFMFGTDLTSAHIVSSAQKLQDLDVVVVDYLQLLGDDLKKGETENNRISRISRNLKKLAISKNCAVVALAQLNRLSEKDKRVPILSDIRDSGSIEQDADSVILLHRESREDVEMSARVAKNRNGETGELSYIFDLKIGDLRETDSIYNSTKG
jgi:replicative DNA helicase